MAKRFVSVRIQSMNGVNVNHFQFDYDLTWMSFFQDSNGRTYARYGGREDSDAESHLNKTSLLAVMRQVLQLHANGDVKPTSLYEPADDAVRTPEDIPPMVRMLAKRNEKCVHCHDVKAATLLDRRNRGTLNKDMVFTYPSPLRLGIQLDAEIQNRVEQVVPDSAADLAGLKAGDSLKSIDGQRVLTFADATRALELVPRTAGVTELTWLRAGDLKSSDVKLSSNWYQSDDPSWRESAGVVGPSSGFWGKRADLKKRQAIGVGGDALAVEVTFIWGQWAKAAGVKIGDYVVSLDGNEKDMTIHQLQSYLHLNRDWGESATITVRRGKQDLDLTFRFPDKPPE